MDERVSKWLCLIIPILLSGCASTKNLEMLESQLRLQEQAITQLQKDLTKANQELRVSQQESQHLRQQLVTEGEKPLLPEQAQAMYRVSGVQINKLMSGGLDQNNQGGDEILAVNLVPHDEMGEKIKIPGTIEVTVLDPSLPAESQQIGHWQYSPEKAPEFWRNSFLGAGYMLKLNWQQPPQNESLTVHAKFTTTDGRSFTASQIVKVTPPSGEEMAAILQSAPSPQALPTSPANTEPNKLSPPAAERLTGFGPMDEELNAFASGETELPSAPPASTPKKPLPDWANDREELTQPELRLSLQEIEPKPQPGDQPKPIPTEELMEDGFRPASSSSVTTVVEEPPLEFVPATQEKAPIRLIPDEEWDVQIAPRQK